MPLVVDFNQVFVDHFYQDNIHETKENTEKILPQLQYSIYVFGVAGYVDPLIGQGGFVNF
jgi:hypothetical protein